MGFVSNYSNEYIMQRNNFAFGSNPFSNLNFLSVGMPTVFAQNFTMSLPPLNFNCSTAFKAPLFNLSEFKLTPPSFNFANNTNWNTPSEFDFAGNMDTFTFTGGNLGTTKTTSSSQSKKVKSGTGKTPKTSVTTGTKIGVSGGYSVAKTIPEKAKPYYSIIQKYAKQYNVPESLILAVITAESGFNPNAVSSCGAKGLMQLMPATAQDYHVTDPYDPEQNIKAGVEILSKYIARYNGDMDKVLAAYNWGPGNLSNKGLTNMPAQTRNYLAKVANYTESYSQA